MNEEKIIVLDINFTRGISIVFVVGLLAFVMAGFLVFGYEEAVASNPQTLTASSAVMRKYYLTKNTFKGADADTACANGYHFASIWEILDTSNLKYNTELGFISDDSGMGPSTERGGWIRTGYYDSGSSIAGYGNCNVWSRNDVYGTYALLNDNFNNLEENIGPFRTVGGSCNLNNVHVWCVED
jgi:hypothetical protein